MGRGARGATWLPGERGKAAEGHNFGRLETQATTRALAFDELGSSVVVVVGKLPQIPALFATLAGELRGVE